MNACERISGLQSWIEFDTKTGGYKKREKLQKLLVVNNMKLRRCWRNSGSSPTQPRESS